MALKERLQADLKDAMKGSRSNEVGVLRMVLSAIHNKQIEKGNDLDDAGIESVLMSEAKKRKEAALAFDTGGRVELAENERAELSILEKYLPKAISAEEVQKEVGRIIAEGKFTEFGPAMKAVMAVLRGKADSSVIQSAVKEALNGNGGKNSL